jgi:hypothetical protein
MLVDGVWYFIVLAMVNFLNLAFYRAATEVQVRHISLFLPVATDPHLDCSVSRCLTGDILPLT